MTWMDEWKEEIKIYVNLLVVTPYIGSLALLHINHVVIVDL